jgi:hypothetical protein
VKCTSTRRVRSTIEIRINSFQLQRSRQNHRVLVFEIDSCPRDITIERARTGRGLDLGILSSRFCPRDIAWKRARTGRGLDLGRSHTGFSRGQLHYFTTDDGPIEIRIKEMERLLQPSRQPHDD